MQEKNKQNVEFILKRLKSILKVESDTSLSESIGVTPQVISNWRKRNTIDYDIVFTICLKLKIDLNWLIYGIESKTGINDISSYGDINAISKGQVKNGQVKGQVLGQVSDTDALYKEGKKVDVQHEDKSVMNNVSGIPFYEQLYATAGNFTDLLNTSKPSSFINLPQIEDCTAVLPVYGSSMKGLIEPGDLIAIKELAGRSEFDPTVPYLVITNEHRMIKYLRADESDPETIWAESTNHKPFRIEAHNILYVYAIKCVIRFF